jgi:(2Fe-2S) ferredoxin
MGGCCKDNVAKKVAKSLKNALADRGLEKNVHLYQSRCLKRCGDGPHLIVASDGHHFTKVKFADAKNSLSTRLSARKAK